MQRTLCTQRLRTVNWRDRRAYIMAHDLRFDPASIDRVRAPSFCVASHDSLRVYMWSCSRCRVSHAVLLTHHTQEAQTGTLLLSGYVRGCNLSAAQNIHLPGLGDFAIEAVRVVNSPCVT